MDFEKIKKLKSFCQENHILVSELSSLVKDLLVYEAKYPFEVYYEDGSISNRLNPNKKPLAIKISWHEVKPFWVWLDFANSVDCPQNELDAFLAKIPRLMNNNSWRLPSFEEVRVVNLHLNNIDGLKRLEFLHPKSCEMQNYVLTYQEQGEIKKFSNPFIYGQGVLIYCPVCDDA